MSAPKKRGKARAAEEDSDEGMQCKDSDSEEENSGEFVQNQSVQVDFDARNPEDSDFHGIKKLLQQLFLKANVNISDLTDTIIAQNYVGSVIKQVEDPADMDSDDEGDSDVFGLTTVVNLTDKKALGCVQQFGEMLRDHCQANAPRLQSKLTQLLGDDDLQLGLVLNERFINLPPQLSVPALHSLWNECERAVRKNMRFDFTHYMLLLKTYRPLDTPGTENAWLYVNPEEELFQKEALLQFSYSVKAERDTAVRGWGGGEQDDDEEMEPFRTLVVVSSEKIPQIMAKMDELFANT